jgi:hypothetical protein
MTALLVRALAPLLGPVLLLAACAAPGPKAPAVPRAIQISMMNAHSGVSMALVNDTWLEDAGVPGATAEARRIEFASISRGVEASTTKVLSDAQLEQLVAYLESDCGWDGLAASGSVPRNGGRYTSAIEVRIDGVAEHAGFVSTMPRALALDFQTCMLVFIGVFNEVYSLQTVHDLDGFREGAGGR